MKVYYTDSALKTLDAKMAFIKGKGAQKASQAIAKAIEEGNVYDRLNGRDRYGRSLTPLRSVRKGKYKGASGPPLAPFGVASRVVTNFRVKPRQRGGMWQVVAGWSDVLSKRGVPFLPFHDLGGSKLPRRSLFGISPRTWQAIRPIVAKFIQDVKAVKV